jgi:TetR/AcrR family transcriptional regulator, transcriptional repressor for nem operon
VRYPSEHKERTRERIVTAAAREFRRRGEEGVGIAGLMQELKLTHGGFYRHFKSKDALFAESLAAAFEDAGAKLMRAASQAPGHEIAAVIDAYLNDLHCMHAGEGCPIAALAADVARLPKHVRAAMDRGLDRYAARFAPFCKGTTAAERRRNALLLFAGMAGTLTIARATADETLRASILKSGRDFYKRSFAP